LFLSIAGATAISNYIDRDIDKLMVRTSKRPLPLGKINPASKALYFGVFILLLSIILGCFVNCFFLVFLFLGVFNSIFVYYLFSKKKTVFNIILASPTAAMPILGGWVAVRPLSIEPFIVAILTIIFVPIHVWCVVLRWKKDYLRARIPMLVLSTTKGEKLIAFLSFLLAACGEVFAFLTISTLSYHILVTILNIVLIVVASFFTIKPTDKNTFVLFKYSTIYMTLLFTIWMVSHL
jgi:protoheme IX farnesyltransferase